MEEIKTLQQCKDEVAKEKGYPCWINVLHDLSDGNILPHDVDSFENQAYELASQFKPSAPETGPVDKPDEIVQDIAGIAWKGAANAFRMYPENKHTFAAYWDASKSQFNKFHSLLKSKTDKIELLSIRDEKREVRFSNLNKENGALHGRLESAQARIKELEEALKGVYNVLPTMNITPTCKKVITDIIWEVLDGKTKTPKP
jgi:hypothetical protein